MSIQYVSPYRVINPVELPFLSDDSSFQSRVIHSHAARILREHGIASAERERFQRMIESIQSSDSIIVLHIGRWDMVSRYPFLVPIIQGQRVYSCPKKFLGKLSTKFFRILSEYI